MVVPGGMYASVRSMTLRRTEAGSSGATSVLPPGNPFVAALSGEQTFMLMEWECTGPLRPLIMTSPIRMHKGTDTAGQDRGGSSRQVVGRACTVAPVDHGREADFAVAGFNLRGVIWIFHVWHVDTETGAVSRL